MLPLISALVLIVLHGPAGAERSLPDGRIPQALRAWAAAHMPPGQSELGKAADESGDSAIAELLCVESAEASCLLSLILQIGWDASGVPSSELPFPLARISEPVSPCENTADRRTADGFFDCRRTRDGPSGA